MNASQRLVLWIASLAAVAAFVFPPAGDPRPDGMRDHKWNPIFSMWPGHAIDYKLLAVEYLIIAALAAVGYFTLNRRD